VRRLARGLSGTLVMLVIAVAALHAQTADPSALAAGWVQESWSIADGLPVNSINGLIQSRTGYIWAATFDGLVRFDGVRFTVYNSANSPGLPSDRIMSVMETRDSALWLLTEQRYLVKFARGRFTHIDESRGLVGGPFSIYEDPAGQLFIGSEQGLGRMEKDRLVPVAPEVIRGKVVSIVRRRDGSLWVATEVDGIFRIADDRAERVSVAPALERDSLFSLFEDPEERLWIGAAKGVWQVPKGALAGIPTIDWRPREIQRFVYVPATGAVLGYGMGGVFRFDPDHRVVTVDDRLHQFTLAVPLKVLGQDSAWHAIDRDLMLNGRKVYTLNPESNRPTGRITDLLFDREGGIWLATDGMGLHRLRRSLFTSYSAPEGLTARNAYVIARDSTDALWVGSLLEGTSRISPDRRTIQNFTPARGYPTQVTSILQDGDRILLATPYGLQTCTLPAMACTKVPSLYFDWPGAYALYQAKDGRLLAGTKTQVLERRGAQWTPMSEWPGRAPARAFAETPDGALWVGTNGGGVVRCLAGHCRTLTAREGLPTDLIRSLHVDGDGWLWIGTEGRGLARLDPRHWPAEDDRYVPAITRYATTDGLYDPVVHEILEDEAGRLWMNSNRGIFWVRRDELNAFAEHRIPRIHSTAYTERDGLRNREGNGGFQPAGAKTRDGRLWFPTQDGIVGVDPARVTQGREPPPVTVEQVTSRGRVLSADTSMLALRPTERDLEITYTALTFVEPGNVRFRYRLDPYDPDWVDAGSRRTAFYTRVPPGHYTFKVAASQGGDRWTPAEATVQLSLAPLFRETGTAKVLLALAIALMGALAYQWRVRSLRQRAVELTGLIEIRTAELQRNEQQLATQNVKLAQLNQLRTRLFANLSHEFRTPLTLILGPLKSLLDGRFGVLSREAREQGDLMLRNTQRLLRLINQILDLTRLQAGSVTVHQQPVELVGFVRSVTQAFTPLAERSRIALVFRSGLPSLTLRADPEQIEKVLLNLLSNAVKFTGNGGIIDVSVGQDGSVASIVVRDSGVGIAEADLPHIFDRFYQADSANTRRYEGTGIGLALVKELVELHGGEIGVTSTPGQGTTFTVRLPLNVAGNDETVVATSATPAAELSELYVLENTSPGNLFRDGSGGTAEEESAEDRTTVLLVDDNPDVRAYVRSVLAPQFHILEAADGKAGLALAREALPDLIVADVMMPELDGLELGRALKSDPMTDAIPVILLTARAESADQVAGLEAGADAYLVKPFDPAVLTACVANLLNQRRRLRERFRLGEAVRPASAPKASSGLDLRLRPLVEAHLVDPKFGPEVLAEVASLSYHQLYRSLRDELGTTPSRYIRTVRAECAATLLKQGAGSVTEIAYAVGFESLSYFRRAFRERFEATPSDFLASKSKS
jgi:signal transduction histidine kinase/ligand-binding sensor domain-containing protein/CheY-like chemotaxis protein/AraC-like DNA-binding protein